jgi:hypothetical protein
MRGEKHRSQGEKMKKIDWIFLVLFILCLTIVVIFSGVSGYFIGQSQVYYPDTSEPQITITQVYPQTVPEPEIDSGLY